MLGAVSLTEADSSELPTTGQFDAEKPYFLRFCRHPELSVS